jgi:hypothetical protein
MMADNKTKPTAGSVEEYLASRANESQLADCRKLIFLLKKLTRKPPTMWGPSIVGFGVYQYTYESGRTGDAPLAGFAIRGRELVLYVNCEDPPQKALLAKLGKHKMSKACLYFKSLADLEPKVLERLVANSIAATKKRHG